MEPGENVRHPNAETTDDREDSIPISVDEAFRQYYPQLTRKARTFNLGDPEDLVQRVFEKAISTVQRNGSDYILNLGWYYRALQTTAIDEARRANRRVDLVFSSDDYEYIDSPNVMINMSENLEFEETLAALSRALEGKPEQWQRIIYLKTVEDLSAKDISQVLNIPIGSVGSSLFRACNFLATSSLAADTHVA